MKQTESAGITCRQLFAVAGAFAGDLVTEEAAQATAPGPVKQIDAGLLNAGYADAGPRDGKPLMANANHQPIDQGTAQVTVPTAKLQPEAH